MKPEMFAFYVLFLARRWPGGKPGTFPRAN